MRNPQPTTDDIQYEERHAPVLRFSNHAGFAVLFSVLAASMVLLVGLAIFRFTLRELVLTSQVRDSQVAFSAADSAIECALFWDKKHPGYQGSVFGYPSGGIEVAHLDTDNDGSDDSVNTAPVSPTANALVLLWVTTKKFDSVNPSTPGVSGCSMGNWEVVDNWLYDSSGSTRARLTLFRAMDATPGSDCRVSIDVTGGYSRLVYSMSEFKNVDTSGTSGSGAIADDDRGSPMCELSGSPNSRPVIGSQEGSTIPSAASGYTLLGADIRAGDHSLATAWSSTGIDTMPTMINGDHSICVEIKGVETQLVPPISQNSNIQCLGADGSGVDISNPDTGWDPVTGWDVVPEVITTSATTTFDMSFPGGRCASVVVGKSGQNTRIEARGYNTCDLDSPRRIERGLRATY